MQNKSSIWVTGGALLTAVLSSACCWLPLLLLAFGASAAGIGGFFEAYRPYLLGATVLLLGGAFYLVYFRKQQCDPDEACAAPHQKLQRANKIMLWVALVAVVAFTFFPNYIGKFLGTTDDPSVNIDKNGLTEFVVDIEGMTCEACAVKTQANLRGLLGVKYATVNYDEKKATILGDAQVTEDAIRRTVEAAGYKVQSIGTSQAAQGSAK